MKFSRPQLGNVLLPIPLPPSGALPSEGTKLDQFCPLSVTERCVTDGGANAVDGILLP